MLADNVFDRRLLRDGEWDDVPIVFVADSEGLRDTESSSVGVEVRERLCERVSVVDMDLTGDARERDVVIVGEGRDTDCDSVKEPVLDSEPEDDSDGDGSAVPVKEMEACAVRDTLPRERLRECEDDLDFACVALMSDRDGDFESVI